MVPDSPLDTREQDLYDRLAAFYDAGTCEFDADLGVYLGFAHRGPGRVLELGCGTGRVALALARAGHEVIGVDRSAAMLSLARARLEREPDLRLSLVRADMRGVALRGRFGLVLIALDGFLHLQDRAAQLACLRTAAAHLSSRGLLVIDLASPSSPGWEDWSPGVRPLVLAWSLRLPDGGHLSRFNSFSVDASRQTHQVTEIYERSGADGSLRRWTVQYPLRFVFPGEVDLLLEAAGFQLEARYGDYELNPFEAGSPRQLVVASPKRLRHTSRRRASGR